MMTASPNDVCLRAHRGKHRIIATNGRNIIFAKQMHHIAAGDASFEDIQGYALIYLQNYGNESPVLVLFIVYALGVVPTNFLNTLLK